MKTLSISYAPCLPKMQHKGPSVCFVWGNLVDALVDMKVGKVLKVSDLSEEDSLCARAVLNGKRLATMHFATRRVENESGVWSLYFKRTW
jgi:hypothetical protein